MSQKRLPTGNQACPLSQVIMCALSTGYFFVVVSRIHQWQPLRAADVPITVKTKP